MSDFKHQRRRTNSNALSLRSAGSAGGGGHARGISRAVIQPRSTHTSDEFLKPFLQSSFDPANFFNANLPPVQQRSGEGAATGGTADLSSQAQALITQLNTHTTRLSNTLTTLTDDILRSGSRLAYEVELLRGETVGLNETLHETLADDVRKFVPEGLPTEPAVTRINEEQEEMEEATTTSTEPEFVKQLQTLTLVRARLDSVIKTFGDSMEFVFPPSELSVSSSFLSVSAPEPGSEQQSSEEKGQQVLAKLRGEIADLLDTPADPVEGIAQAAQRVEELKELTTVWRGTREEKGRMRFIESLAKMVEDKHRELMREMELAAKKNEAVAATGRTRKSSVTRDAAVEEAKVVPGGFGLLNQLQRLRSGL
ncbi:uncharacterized protein F5Z01DRAFT_388505 [Emericellopsis atlantica]|uniref:Uncharacterized protein n=1 Tax=Emericellopsis atlantica TaxID=2614577 RepID=A0A9P8CRW8_9HYPO|nr:uncharacterized protein F5Z01DRAFT_388505 [Emericellopsis atlantica]KAG9257429.1 hypothetical protein F5Z01DRAFT_388505 [Emericellopsis atlantica]